MAKFEKTLFCILALAVILSFPFRLYAQLPQYQGSELSDACSQCFKAEHRQCMPTCAKKPDRQSKEKCLDGCVTGKCAKVCNYVSDSVPGSSSKKSETVYDQQALSCDYCLKRMAGTSCYKDCAGKFNAASCQERCAKARCAHKCSLPVDPTSSRPGTAKPHRCESCKLAKQLLCNQSCSTRGEAGRVTCQVACVAKKCQRECDLQSEEE